ncbi:hypothetical protein [Kineosporia succinea]|uniref:Uncharacterized protein n=1 Tax=Kineosporia succinea TaxID=84632 RepID=A0ABT9P9R8_9ACTN|nr:hypothetical protein [Kineosporia succinea]MDP9828915.1 hypothetical protein [Kineosporia succinea]
MAESLDGWGTYDEPQPRQRPRRRKRPVEAARSLPRYIDRNRRKMLILSLLLACVMLTVTVVAVTVAGSRANYSDTNRGRSEMVSQCQLMYPDDSAKSQQCVDNAP